MAEVKVKIFKNFSNEKFVCSWDKVAYTFQPGQEMYVEDWKADHFAKHLVDHEMNKAGQITSNKFARKPLEDLALPVEKTEIPVAELIDVQKKAEKVIKKTSKKVDEEEFADLKK